MIIYAWIQYFIFSIFLLVFQRVSLTFFSWKNIYCNNVNIIRWSGLEKAYPSFHKAAAGHGSTVSRIQFHCPFPIYL